MLDSVITSGHHYYLMVFKSSMNFPIESTLSKLSDNNNYNKIVVLNDRLIYHCQKRIKKFFGSKELLQKNIDTNTDHVWYDLYIGQTFIGEDKVFFIGFPYKGMQKFIIDKIVPEFFKDAKFFKPSVDKILQHMKNRNSEIFDETDPNSINKLENNLNFKADIIKYVAMVTDISADKIQISGKNPLNSKVFKILSDAEETNVITINTSSMKLNCKLFNDKLNNSNGILSGNIDILFDYFGNYRFWLPYVDQLKGPETLYHKTLNMIDVVLQYFNEIEGYEDKYTEVLSDKEDFE